MKTIAFEMVEQMGWRAPHWYVQAVSGGIGPLGVLKGFTELYEAGLIDRVPKLAIVQAEGCAPMVRAWEQGLDVAEPVQPDTLVTVLSTGKPGLAYTMLKQASDRHGGAMTSVSDGDAFRAMRHVARVEGFSMEPAASVAFAGLEKLLADGVIKPNERVVVNCSGHTFSAEKHALEDRHTFHLQLEVPVATHPATDPTAAPSPLQDDVIAQGLSQEGLAAALEHLDEQITTVVVIDDNPHDSRLIRRLLQNYKSYRVFEASNGVDGLDLVRQRQPDLVVLDLTLPDTDGFSILNELKADQRTREIPVVIVSAKSLTSQEWQLLRRHTQSIWQKGSFSAHQLASHVMRILEHAPAQANPLIDQLPQDLNELHRPRVLVIDDYVSDARLMRRLLEARRRFEVIEAHSGGEALKAIEDATPDLIILDLMLPDINGEQLLEQLRKQERTQEVPVIVVSAKDIDPTLQAQLTAQADSVWSKGMLDRSSLLARVETILPEQSE
jgi:threonine synthase